MPTLRNHTHLQAAQADTQTKACKRVCLPNPTTDRPKDNQEEQRRHNRRLAQWRVQWLIEHSTSHQILWYVDSLVLRNPPPSPSRKPMQERPRLNTNMEPNSSNGVRNLKSYMS